MKLHIGHGDKYIPGFVHIDIRKHKYTNIIASAYNLSMIKDCSISVIYSSHMLEHIKRNYIDATLTEWYRVLKIGGIARIAVPDFEKITEIYSKYHDMELILGLLYGNNDEKYNKHCISFDFRYLRKKLRLAGFDTIRRYRWEDTIHKDYDDFSRSYIPHMDTNGILVSLNVEAVKRKCLKGEN